MLYVLLGSCGGDAVAPHHPLPPTDATSLYWELTLDHRAITLSTVAPYDTIRLTATPRDATGAPVAGLGPVTYRSTAPAELRVDADGMVRAVAPGMGFKVIAELATRDLRHLDTAIVNVTTNSAPQQLASLSIQPIPPDSARIAMIGDATVFSFKFISPLALDTARQVMTGLRVAYSTSDSTVIDILDQANGMAVAAGPGRATLIATATAYGVTKADTAVYTATMPFGATISIANQPVGIDGSIATVFAPSEVAISPGGMVRWRNTAGRPIDVTFDDPAQAAAMGALLNCGAGDPGGAGDIPAFGDATGNGQSAANCRSRRFLTPGVYPFHSATTGATGRIIIDDGVPES